MSSTTKAILVVIAMITFPIWFTFILWVSFKYLFPFIFFGCVIYLINDLTKQFERYK